MASLQLSRHKRLSTKSFTRSLFDESGWLACPKVGTRMQKRLVEAGRVPKKQISFCATRKFFARSTVFPGSLFRKFCSLSVKNSPALTRAAPKHCLKTLDEERNVRGRALLVPLS